MTAKQLNLNLNGSKYFSCMDMPSAYWHIPMEEDSIPKTAFQVPQGKFEMLRMPYGMKNSQATQQRLMDQALGPVPNTRAYVDNTFTHTAAYKEHLEALKLTFQQLRKYNLSVRLDKCIFAQHKVEQFGLVISNEGVVIYFSREFCKNHDCWYLNTYKIRFYAKTWKNGVH